MSKTKIFIVLFAILTLFYTGCGENPAGSEGEDLLPRSQMRPLEEDLLVLVNAARTEESVAELAMDEDLREVAYEHSEDMFVREFFSHTNPDGDDFADRADMAGITYTIIGENIAWNNGYSDPVQAAHDSLMASPGHRANILNEDFTYVGVGIASDGDKYYYTELFAALSRSTYYIARIVIDVDQAYRNPWEAVFETFQEAWNK